MLWLRRLAKAKNYEAPCPFSARFEETRTTTQTRFSSIHFVSSCTRSISAHRLLRAQTAKIFAASCQGRQEQATGGAKNALQVVV